MSVFELKELIFPVYHKISEFHWVTSQCQTLEKELAGYFFKMEKVWAKAVQKDTEKFWVIASKASLNPTV